jgi:hypothetical protein
MDDQQSFAEFSHVALADMSEVTYSHFRKEIPFDLSVNCLFFLL